MECKLYFKSKLYKDSVKEPPGPNPPTISHVFPSTVDSHHRLTSNSGWFFGLNNREPEIPEILRKLGSPKSKELILLLSLLDSRL